MQQTVSFKAFLHIIGSRPVAYHKIFTDITGSLAAGVFLSQCCYWSQVAKDEDGWFYHTADQFQEELGISRKEQATARRILTQHGFLQEKRAGLPARLYYRVDYQNLISALDSHSPTPKTPNSPPDQPVDQVDDVFIDSGESLISSDQPGENLISPKGKSRVAPKGNQDLPQGQISFSPKGETKENIKEIKAKNIHECGTASLRSPSRAAPTTQPALLFPVEEPPKPKKPKPPKTAERDPLLDNPAVAAVRELTHLWPPALARTEIAETVTDIDLWRKCVKFVVLRTGRNNNYDYMLDCYRDPSKMNPPIRSGLRPVDTTPRPPIGMSPRPTHAPPPTVPGLPERQFGPDGYDQFGYDRDGSRNPFLPPLDEQLSLLRKLLTQGQTPEQFFAGPLGPDYPTEFRVEFAQKWQLVKRGLEILEQTNAYQQEIEYYGFPFDLTDNVNFRLFWDRINGVAPVAFFWWPELIPYFGASDQLPDPKRAVS